MPTLEETAQGLTTLVRAVSTGTASCFSVSEAGKRGIPAEPASTFVSVGMASHFGMAYSRIMAIMALRYVRLPTLAAIGLGYVGHGLRGVSAVGLAGCLAALVQVLRYPKTNVASCFRVTNSGTV